MAETIEAVINFTAGVITGTILTVIIHEIVERWNQE